MSLAKTLWKENEDLARAALEHRFVRGIGDGTLPLESFQSYVAQDAFFSWRASPAPTPRPSPTAPTATA